MSENQNTQVWYNYAILPIDFYWSKLKSPGEVLREMTCDVREMTCDDREIDELGYFLKDLTTAMDAFRSMGWRSTVVNEGVFYVPFEDEFRYGFALKESDNGTTYIASPIPFPHYEEYLNG